MKKHTKPPFIQIDLPVNNTCNARCEFCKIWENEDYNSRTLPAEDWIKTVKKLKEFTHVEYVCIAGGEPLLYKDIFKLIKGLDDLNIITTIVTNGSLCNKKICRKLLDSGIKTIDFSIDNFAAKHNKARGIPKLFEKCVNAINTLKKLNPDIPVGISTLIYENNIRDIPDFLEWVLKELPIDKINFQAYNQVVKYSGKNWWKNDPLWPKDKEVISKVMDYLSKRAEEEKERINNYPVQFEKFKKYFLNPEQDLGIKCPAGTFNFSASHKGDIVACIAEKPLGNIKENDPVKVYQEEFSKVREKAKNCKENCHFLINCYFPLHWKRWDQITKKMVENEDKYKPGKLMIPPEIRDIVKKGLPGYGKKIEYSPELDIIGKYDSIKTRKMPPGHLNKYNTIYLCGENSEVHRWGVSLDENDFFKQIDALKEYRSLGEKHEIIIGVRRTNFFKISKTIELIRKIRNKKKSKNSIKKKEIFSPIRFWYKNENKIKENNKKLPIFRITPLHNIKKRFYRYFKRLRKITKDEGIKIGIVDNELNKLLSIIEKKSVEKNFNQDQFLRTLGPACKDVFICPKGILFDLMGTCNVDCIYCRKQSDWNKEYWKDHPPEEFGKLDLEVIDNVLPEAKNIGIQEVYLAGGGEPTIHPHFSKIIDAITNNQMRFNLATNGSMLHKYNEQLLKSTCYELIVSMSYGSEKSWKKTRPKSNVKIMKRIHNNVKQLSNLKKNKNKNFPRIKALYIINKHNYTEILDMVYHAKEIGANSVWFQLVHLDNFSKKRLKMTEKEMRIAKDNLGEARKLSKKLGLEFPSLYLDFELEHYNEEKGDWSEKGLLHQGCYVGWRLIFIGLRKQVFMCCGTRMTGLLNNSGKKLKEIWEGDIYRRYRNDGLIMHRENPLAINGKPLYDAYCDSCDNHDLNTVMMRDCSEYGLMKFVER